MRKLATHIAIVDDRTPMHHDEADFIFIAGVVIVLIGAIMRMLTFHIAIVDVHNPMHHDVVDFIFMAGVVTVLVGIIMRKLTIHMTTVDEHIPIHHDEADFVFMAGVMILIGAIMLKFTTTRRERHVHRTINGLRGGSVLSYWRSSLSSRSASFVCVFFAGGFYFFFFGFGWRCLGCGRRC